MDNKMIIIGKILKPHGKMAEVKVRILTDSPEVFSLVEYAYLAPPKGGIDLLRCRFDSLRIHKGHMLIGIEGVETIEDADKYRNWLIQVPLSDHPKCEEGEYFVDDLMGCRVFTTDGQDVGRVVKVLQGGPQDVLDVKRPDSDRKNLVPMVKRFIKSVDVEKREIAIEPMEGLLDL